MMNMTTTETDLSLHPESGEILLSMRERPVRKAGLARTYVLRDAPAVVVCTVAELRAMLTETEDGPGVAALAERLPAHPGERVPFWHGEDEEILLPESRVRTVDWDDETHGTVRPANGGGPRFEGTDLARLIQALLSRMRPHARDVETGERERAASWILHHAPGKEATDLFVIVDRDGRTFFVFYDVLEGRLFWFGPGGFRRLMGFLG